MDQDAAFAYVHTFEKHRRDITGVVHLSDDVMCSLDVGGNLFTWRALTKEDLQIIQVIDCAG